MASKAQLPDLNWREAPAVARARAKLTELLDRRNQQGRALEAARQKAMDAERALLAAEVALVKGEATDGEQKAARLAFESAKADFEAARAAPQSEILAKAIRELAEYVERVEGEEKHRVMEAFKPVYADALREHIKTIEAARPALLRMRELYTLAWQAFGNSMAEWPQALIPWELFDDRPGYVAGNGHSPVDDYRRAARKAGLLD